MLEKSGIIRFFDERAAAWDAAQLVNNEVINKILDCAGIDKGSRVLDVACGTGVLVPYYLEREVECVCGVDLSPAMIEKARSKFTEPNVSLICADAETDDIGSGYDSIVIYNAFPHFLNPEALLSHLCNLLSPGGTITIAHGSSREAIDAHHKGEACKVSCGLIPAKDLAWMLSKYAKVLNTISNDRMYLVSAKKEFN